MDGNNNWSGSKHEVKQWDSEAPKIEYFNELKRVSINQIIWGANHFISRNSNRFKLLDYMGQDKRWIFFC